MEQGIDEADVERSQHLAVRQQDHILEREGLVGVRGREGDRVNRGRLDPKDLYGWQANGSPDRLTRPLVRVGGELTESDWGTAMDRVATTVRAELGYIVHVPCTSPFSACFRA